MCGSYEAANLGYAADAGEPIEKGVTYDTILTPAKSTAFLVINHETGEVSISGETYDAEKGEWASRSESFHATDPAGVALGDFFHVLSVTDMARSLISALQEAGGLSDDDVDDDLVNV